MSELVRNRETGEYGRRWADGSITPVSAQEIEARERGFLGNVVRSAGRSAEEFGRGVAELAMPISPEYARAGGAREANRERLQAAREDTAGMAAAAPLAAGVGGLLPDLAVTAGTGGAGLGGTVARRGALYAAEGAMLEAGRHPEAPGRAAAVGGAVGLGGGVAGDLGGAFVRGRMAARRSRMSPGTVRGIETGEAIIEEVDDRARMAGETGRTGGDLFPERAPAGSASGVDIRDVGEAAETGWRARAFNMIGRDAKPNAEFNDEAKALGFRLTPGVEKNSKSLRQLEASMESGPGGAAGFQPLREHNENVLKRTIVEALGGDGEDLTAGVRGRIMGELETTFENIARRAGTVGLKRETAFMIHRLDQLTDPVVKRHAAGIVADLPERMKGAELSKRISKLRADADRNWRSESGDLGRAEAMDIIADGLDKALMDAVPKDVANTLQTARERWRFMRTLERGRAVDPHGEVRPGVLSNAVQKVYRREYVYGEQTGNAAIDKALRAIRVADGMRDIVGNSGTATRAKNPVEAIMGGWANQALVQGYLGELTPAGLGKAGLGVGGRLAVGAGVAGGASGLLD